MKKIILSMLFLSMCFMQRDNQKSKKQFREWNNETKALYYQAERISPEQALFYQMSLNFIPFSNLGYAYADNWKRGFKWDLAIIGAVLLSSSLYENDECYSGGSTNSYYYCDDANNTTSDILLLGALGMGIYKIVDVYKTAEIYNNKLFKRLFGSKKPPVFSMNYSLKENSPKFSLNIPLN